MIFSEIYGSYYRATEAILREAVRGNLTGKALNALIQENAFGESLLTIPEELVGGSWKLLRDDYTTLIQEEPTMPLTLLEKRWMKAMLLDPRIQLFKPDMKGLEDIEPLFTPDMVVYYDRYTDGDDYKDPGYIQHFETILQALREKKNLVVTFESGKHEQLNPLVTPYFLEYSEKDDRFRLVAAGLKRRWVINLSRILEVELADKNDPIPLKPGETDTLTFELEDRRNALERVLLHFSHLEKETKKLEEDKYQVTLKYDHQDETEMVMRILSFGPAIRVLEPESFINLLRERIGKQRKLAPSAKAEG